MVPKIKRKRFVKSEEEASPFFGKEPSKRSIEEAIENGVVIIDKPCGPTSHQVAAWVKEILHLNKAGHGGTLDPNVSGVLPIALENATKAIGLMHEISKEYVCVMQLHSNVDEKKLREVIKSFVGKIWQTPPKEAAVKRVRRQRTIYYINIIEMDGKDVLFKVGCEGGTYIRVLCEDIGKKLGVGAHMEELRRTKTGIFEEEDAIFLQELLDAYIFWKEEGKEFIKKIIYPVETLVEHLPDIIIKDSAVDAICHGANLMIPGVAMVETGIKRGSKIAIKTLKGEVVAIAEALMSTREIIEKDRGIVADTKRVIMKPGTYPKMWKS
ncbi:MAG: RNA-guided pseudouridylation complex pseudouridine synthase subunit Cbf5 [Thermoplasmatales archaeon]|nr:RNA-guided pseudouridylation complex pseudouridine synthase subunit Cbf5 [Thermoplasmatales archaeon]